MKMKCLFFSALLLSAMSACKQEPTTTETPPAEEMTTGTAKANQNPNLAANMPWTFLTHQLFQHRVTVPGDRIDRKGHWMDLNEDGTYDYGIWGDKTYSGTWTYDEATTLLVLKPSGKEKMSEWMVKHHNDNLILLGTSTYGDNPQQVQWVRREQRPEPNASPADDQE